MHFLFLYDNHGITGCMEPALPDTMTMPYAGSSPIGNKGSTNHDIAHQI